MPNNAAKTIMMLPESARVGEIIRVYVAFRNVGDTVWSRAGKYHLGSQNPQDNDIWGNNRWVLPSEFILPPAPPNFAGAVAVFNLQLPTPATPGAYVPAFRMVQDEVEWFGETAYGDANNGVIQILPATDPDPTPPPQFPAIAEGDVGWCPMLDTGELTVPTPGTPSVQELTWDNAGAAVVLDGGHLVSEVRSGEACLVTAEVVRASDGCRLAYNRVVFDPNRPEYVTESNDIVPARIANGESVKLFHSVKMLHHTAAGPASVRHIFGAWAVAP